MCAEQVDKLKADYDAKMADYVAAIGVEDDDTASVHASPACPDVGCPVLLLATARHKYTLRLLAPTLGVLSFSLQRRATSRFRMVFCWCDARQHGPNRLGAKGRSGCLAVCRYGSGLV